MWKSLAYLLPVIIPSWRFFDSIGPSPRIEITTDGTNWIFFDPRPANIPIWKMTLCLFWNPAWNESLYVVSLMERVIADDRRHARDEIARRIADRHPDLVAARLVVLERNAAGIEKRVVRQLYGPVE